MSGPAAGRGGGRLLGHFARAGAGQDTGRGAGRLGPRISRLPSQRSIGRDGAPAHRLIAARKIVPAPKRGHDFVQAAPKAANSTITRPMMETAQTMVRTTWMPSA